VRLVCVAVVLLATEYGAYAGDDAGRGEDRQTETPTAKSPFLPGHLAPLWSEPSHWDGLTGLAVALSWSPPVGFIPTT
jgi:hypothetical protein